MAAYAQRKVVVTRHEYVLTSPAHSSEVGKAFAAAQQDMNLANQVTDIFVESSDEMVIVYWTESKEQI